MGQATKSCTHDYLVVHGIQETKQNLFYSLLAHSLTKAWKWHEKSIQYGKNVALFDAFTEHIHYWRLFFFLNLRWALVSDTGDSYTMIICFISIKWNTTWKRSIWSLILFHWWTIFQISLLMTSERLMSSEIFRP